jgi:hypothetical protein
LWFQNIAQVEDRKRAETDYKRQQEIESEAAKALAEELVKSAGLEMPVVEIISQANRNQTGNQKFYLNYLTLRQTAFWKSLMLTDF